MARPHGAYADTYAWWPAFHRQRGARPQLVVHIRSRTTAKVTCNGRLDEESPVKSLLQPCDLGIPGARVCLAYLWCVCFSSEITTRSRSRRWSTRIRLRAIRQICIVRAPGSIGPLTAMACALPIDGCACAGYAGCMTCMYTDVVLPSRLASAEVRRHGPDNRRRHLPLATTRHCTCTYTLLTHLLLPTISGRDDRESANQVKHLKSVAAHAHEVLISVFTRVYMWC